MAWRGAGNQRGTLFRSLEADETWVIKRGARCVLRAIATAHHAQEDLLMADILLLDNIDSF